MLTSHTAGTLHARYRRVLSLGDVLDESIRLFRQHWITFALVSAVSLIPPGLFDIWLDASGPFTNPLTLDDLRSGRLAQASAGDPQLGGLIASATVSALFYCIWPAAVTATTEVYLRGGEPNLSRMYRRALRRFFVVFLGIVVIALRLSGLTAIASVLVFLAIFPGLVGIVPGVALLVWWLRPGARKAWVKWLIILCTPLGLPTYFGVKWSMFVAAAVLERLGPFAALRRSSELVAGQVFRALSILTVSSLIVAVLLHVPQLLVEIPLVISTELLEYGSATEAILSGAARVVLGILFQSVGVIVYTVMFIDLRNRREGTDMAERLAQLEVTPMVTVPHLQPE